MVELSEDLKKLVGGCFGRLPDDEAEQQINSAVPVYRTLEELDSHVNNIGRIVDNVARRATDFLVLAASDIEYSFNIMGTYIAVEHLPPTPCCVIGKALCDILNEHLDGKSSHPASCTYHT
ncbi:MAG: hypothetical protein L7F77_13920 [Candidatus Magnetominusculus sp. LBB02]|nr:hypothetical protein [Candidatus Magnetominusculus sp. LBB02]